MIIILHQHSIRYVFTRIKNLVLGHHKPTYTVLVLELAVGVLVLGVLVEGLHVGVGGGTVQVIVQLLHILPVVPLQNGPIEHDLLVIQPDSQMIKFDLQMMKNDLQYQHTFPFLIFETEN